MTPTTAPRRGPRLVVERAGDAPACVRVAAGDDTAGAIADAVAVAATLVLPAAAGERGHLVDLDVAYLAPAAGEEAVATGRVLRRGREIAYIAVDVRTAGGTPVAAGRVMWFVAATPSASVWRAPMPGGAAPLVGSPGEAAGDETLATSLVRAAAAALPPAGIPGGAATLALYLGRHAPARGPLAADASVVHRRDRIVATRVTLGAGGRVVATGGVTYRLETPGR